MASYYSIIFIILYPFEAIIALAFLFFGIYKEDRLFSMLMRSISGFLLIIIECFMIPAKIYFNNDCTLDVILLIYVFIRSLVNLYKIDIEMKKYNLKLKDVITDAFKKK